MAESQGPEAHTSGEIVNGNMELNEPQSLKAHSIGETVNEEVFNSAMEHKEPSSLKDYANGETVKGDMVHIVPQTQEAHPNGEVVIEGTVNHELVNGEVVIGDMEYDGRVILYIIKGLSPSPMSQYRISKTPSLTNSRSPQPMKPLTSTTSSP